jgi:hypothetical protein
MSQSGEHVASTATQQQDASIDALITQLETATCTVPRRSAIKGHGVSAEAALAARRRRHLEAQQQVCGIQSSETYAKIIDPLLIIYLTLFDSVNVILRLRFVV